MSTSSPFPLLKLPLLALETVVNLMSPATVLILSFQSKEFTSRLSIVKWKIEYFEWIINKYPVVGVTLHSGFGKCWLEIGTQRQYHIRTLLRRKKGTQVETMNLNGTTVSLETPDRWLLIAGTVEDLDNYINFKSRLDILENLTKFLMSFVRSSKFKLDYCLEENFLSKDFFVWEYVREYPIDLAIKGITYAYESRVTPDDLKFLLDNLKFGYLHLHVSVSETNFKYQGDLEANELMIRGDNKWIDLRNMNCQRVVIYTAVDDVEQIEHILNKWIQGSSMENLEFLKIRKNKSFNPDEYLKSLKHENTRFSHVDISNQIGDNFNDNCVFRDIQRESDGRWGTLCIDLWRLYFIVWTPKKLEKCCYVTRIKLGLE